MVDPQNVKPSIMIYYQVSKILQLKPSKCGALILFELIISVMSIQSYNIRIRMAKYELFIKS